MRGKKMITCLIFSFLLTMLFPSQVLAAGEPLKIQVTVTGESEKECAEKAEKLFEKKKEIEGENYSLKEIKYEITDTQYLDKKEKKVELKEEPKRTFKEQGVTYILKFVKEEKSVSEIQEQSVTAYDDYDWAVTAADVPSTKTVDAVNEVTGETEQVTCNFVEVAPQGTTAVDNVMTITFSDYDAQYYEWNGQLLPHDDETPPIAGQESALLSSVGAAPGSEITDYYWSGNPYTVDGVVYRDAAATVRQQVQMYRAHYVGTLTTPEETETVYQAVYETPDLDGRVEYTVTATAEYAKKSYLPYIVAGVGIVVLAGLIAAILMVLAKKKKEQEEQ